MENRVNMFLADLLRPQNVHLFILQANLFMKENKYTPVAIKGGGEDIEFSGD